MFLSVVLTGCELLDEEEEYVIVTIRAMAQADVYSAAGELNPHGKAGYVLIDITKSGGEGVHEQKDTDSLGYTDVVTATFNVYKEQRIEIVATVQGYDPSRTVYSEFEGKHLSGRSGLIIGWDEIFESAGGFGESCAFEKVLYVAMIEP